MCPSEDEPEACTSLDTGGSRLHPRPGSRGTITRPCFSSRIVTESLFMQELKKLLDESPGEEDDRVHLVAADLESEDDR